MLFALKKQKFPHKKEKKKERKILKNDR